MQSQTFQAPKWWYIGQRPTTDDVYFENMSRIIFHAGLNWQVIKAKWPAIRQAFAYFSIGRVAEFGDAEVTRLLNDKNVIRSRGKIQAIILNARQFQAIHKQYSSFKNTSKASTSQKTMS
jgi:DNA-3-methyladenine glycosylase I